MTGLTLGLVLIVAALVIYGIAILIAKIAGKRVTSKSVFDLKTKDFLYFIPFFLLWLVAGISMVVGIISLVVSLLQYLGVL